jgi:hypothetical protein
MKLSERLAAALPRHLRLHEYDSGVLNLNAVDFDRELVRADVDAFRAALTEAGYVEVKSWIAWQNRSWMSDGVFAGVSFEVRKVGS